MSVRANLKSWWVVLVFLLWMGCATVEGRTIYVDDDEPADFNNIKAAINDSNDGDTIIVRDGTYTGGGNRDIDFLGKPITVRSENGPENCIIDCQGTETEPHRGFYFNNGEDSNSVVDGFTIINGYASSVSPEQLEWSGGGILCRHGSGPTIRNCIITGNTTLNGTGGGIRASGGLITNCMIKGNYAHGMQEYGPGGGGISCGGQATVSNCTISGNTATTSGGGIRCTYGNPKVINCVIVGNSAVHGGGIDCHWGGDAMISNCTISSNLAYSSGGGIKSLDSSPILANCILWGDSSPFGPEISNYCLYGSFVINISYSNVQGGQEQTNVYPGCTLDWGPGNIDADPRFGTPGSWGFIEGMVSYWTLDGNAEDPLGGNHGTVHGNPVWTAGQVGGSLYFDGDGDYVDCGNDSSVNLTNNFSISMWFNSDNAGPNLLICKGNVPAYESGGAYTIFCVPISGMLVFLVRDSNNSDFGFAVTAVPLNQWTHVVGTFSDGNITLYKNGFSEPNSTVGTPTIHSHSNDEPLGIGAEGDGGMAFDGRIDDVRIYNRALSGEEIEQLYHWNGDYRHGDYHLQSQAGRWDPNSESWVQDDVISPCIDAGNPGCPLRDEPNDPNNIRINMGAYGGTAEASKTPADWRNIADLTNDWAVDFNDLAAFVDYWLDTGECIPSDLNRSQFVDFNDFAIFGQWWQINYSLCFPRWHPDYANWITAGQPDCWCYSRQCHGDADGLAQGDPKTGYHYVGTIDLEILLSVWVLAEPGCWPAKYGDCPNYNPCVDFDHDLDVDDNDGDIAQPWYGVKEPPHGPGVPADCLQY
jgi:predicted outer membrane repeat protein